MEKLVARSVQRWKSLSPVQKVVFCIAVICATLWGGSKDGLLETIPATESDTRFAVGNLVADATVVAATGDASGDSNPVMTTIVAATGDTSGDLNFVTTNDIARGWRMVSETAGNALVPMPAGTVTNEPLRRRGGFDWAFRVEPPNWRFPYAGGVLTGVTVLARGEVRPNARTTFFPVPLTNGVSLLPMAQWRFVGGEPSVFAHAVTPSNSLLLAWWNALAGRDAHCPTNLQMELLADGAFAWRTMDRATTYAPVYPFDWDGDGLANEVDPEPSVANPMDAHGTNAEWYRLVCSNVFERVEAPEGATGDAGSEAPSEAAVAVPGIRFRADVQAKAYYFVDVVVSEGPAPITFTADRASRLGSPVVVAQAGVTNHVPLLVGVKYAVSSPSPLVFSVPEHVVVMRSDASNATVQCPLNFSAVEGFAGATRIYSMDVQPVDPGGTFSWSRSTVRSARLLSTASISSCTCWSGLGNTVSFGCGYNEGCHGGCKATGTYEFEFASFAVTGGVCRCEFDDPSREIGDTPPETEFTSGVAISFSHPAVIFEETYQESPGVWEPRRSTRVRLDVSAYGGPNGGTASFTCENLSKLTPIACGPLALPSTMTLEAGESYGASFLCEGVEASAEADDVVVCGTFTENTASAESMQSEAKLSVFQIRLMTAVEACGNPCRERHTYGVAEVVNCLQNPVSPIVFWQIGDGKPFNEKTFRCPLSEQETVFRVSVGSVVYRSRISILEPSNVICEEASIDENSYRTPIGTAGMFAMMLRRIQLLPLSVSFGNLYVEEVPTENATHTGYFTQMPFIEMSHGYSEGAGYWVRVLPDNVLSVVDHVSCGATPAPWSKGGMIWSLPMGWHTNNVSLGTPPIKLIPCDVKAVYTMLSGDGTVVLSKLGHWMSRNTNSVIVLDGEVKHETEE